MNIMLASVTERTHEIGIRKSLGARRRDILMQFVIESIVMACAGGGIGVLLALIVSDIVDHFWTFYGALERRAGGIGSLHRGGALLWNLPGQPGRQTRSH